LKNSYSLFLIIAFLASSSSAFSQTIPEKNFTKPNSPVFVMNGFVNFSAALRNQATAFEQGSLPDGNGKNHFNNPQAIGNDTQVFFKTGVMTEDGAKYGAVAKVEFNINSSGANENPNLDQAFFFTEHSFGKFEIGNNQAVNQKMKVGPARFARGAGGINGKYLESVNLSMLANSSQTSSVVCNGAAGSTECANVKLPRFILLAQSPIGHGGYAKSFYRGGASNIYQSASYANYGSFNRSRFRALKDDSFDGVEDATKLSYYTPRISGFQFGASYTPDSANNGATYTNIYDVDFIRIKNIVSLGANYSEDFNNLGVALSATAEKGKTQNSKSPIAVQRDNLFSYDLAASLSYFGFTLGASYGSWGNSLQPKSGVYSCDYDSSKNLASQNCSNNSKKFADPYYYTLGLAYKFGPIATSITSLKSTFQNNDYEAISLGLDYKLSKDFMPYLELTKFTLKSNQPKASDIENQAAISSSQRQLKDNQGYVFLTGILYSF
jgi:hypothetical protein